MTTSFSITSFTGPTTLVRYRRDDEPMPTLSDGDSYTTPAISVPPNNDNPYILREQNPNGTVFIAVGAIVGAMLIAFILFHLIRSLKASSMAKKTLASDKQLYEKYQSNNNTAYGITPTSTNNLNLMNTEYQPSVAKLPLLSHHPSRSVLGGALNQQGSQNASQVNGDTSTIYASETGHATSKHDLTKMFISPTAEVMTHKRVRSSHYGGANVSSSNLSILAGANPAGSNSTSNLANPNPATSRHSQLIPSLYINNETNNSDYSLGLGAHQPGSPPQQGAQGPRSGRKTIPSMYLEDLIDDNHSSK